MNTSNNHPYLPIAEGNTLIHKESKRTQKRGTDNDDDYYEEIAPSGEVVARYHVWHHMSIYPPQNSDEGWDKFDFSGSKIASGKCR
ncbi:MAG: hypothetical protein WBK26_13850 [Burkholderiaceae bacterium]